MLSSRQKRKNKKTNKSFYVHVCRLCSTQYKCRVLGYSGCRCSYMRKYHSGMIKVCNKCFVDAIKYIKDDNSNHQEILWAFFGNTRKKSPTINNIRDGMVVNISHKHLSDYLMLDLCLIVEEYLG